MKQGFRLNDYGSNIIITIIDSNGEDFDLSTATFLELRFKKPDNTSISKLASLVNTGVDGKIQYVVESGFLDMTGLWEVQAYIENPSGRWHSNINSFYVWENLE